MNFNTAVSRATEHLLRSEQARTCAYDGNNYVLEMHREEPDVLVVDTWGWDHRVMFVPQERKDLIRRKIILQLRKADGPLCGPDNIELRYLLDILHRESNQ